MSPLDFIRSHADVFARCGSVVASYRSRNGRRCGPYYRLAYRAEGRQRSLYLGASEELAAQVRSLLTELQARRDYYRMVARSERRRRENLLHLKRQWQQAALARGLYARGWELRGWRPPSLPRLSLPRVSLTLPLPSVPYRFYTNILRPLAAPVGLPPVGVPPSDTACPIPDTSPSPETRRVSEDTTKETRRVSEAGEPSTKETRRVSEAGEPSTTETQSASEASTPFTSETRRVSEAEEPSTTETRRVSEAEEPSTTEAPIIFADNAPFPETQIASQAGTPATTETRRVSEAGEPSTPEAPITSAATPTPLAPPPEDLAPRTSQPNLAEGHRHRSLGHPPQESQGKSHPLANGHIRPPSQPTQPRPAVPLAADKGPLPSRRLATCREQTTTNRAAARTGRRPCRPPTRLEFGRIAPPLTKALSPRSLGPTPFHFPRGSRLAASRPPPTERQLALAGRPATLRPHSLTSVSTQEGQATRAFAFPQSAAAMKMALIRARLAPSPTGSTGNTHRNGNEWVDVTFSNAILSGMEKDGCVTGERELPAARRCKVRVHSSPLCRTHPASRYLAQRTNHTSLLPIFLRRTCFSAAEIIWGMSLFLSPPLTVERRRPTRAWLPGNPPIEAFRDQRRNNLVANRFSGAITLTGSNSSHRLLLPRSKS